MNNYEEALKKAMLMDEQGEVAEKKKNYREAAECFAEASRQYANAAHLLLDLMEGCDKDEEEDYKKSIDRLIKISQEMMAHAEELQKRTAGSSSCLENDEDEIVYKPESNLPDIHFSDIVGLEDVKQQVMDTIINPVLYPEVYQRFGMKKCGGLLLFGPPGGGKTLLARAIANESHLPFFCIRCSDIVSKFFGAAEKHLKALFNAARREGKAVIFFDEAEALAARRGNNSTVMARLVPEFLSQIDGFEQFDGHLIVIFASNRPYDIDPAFLRYGRLSNLAHITLPDAEIRLSLLEKEMGKRPAADDIDLKGAALATERYSCADMVNVVNTAALHPIRRTIARIEQGEKDPWDEVITQADLDKARTMVLPSVEEAELQRLEKWQTTVRGRAAAKTA